MSKVKVKEPQKKSKPIKDQVEEVNSEKTIGFDTMGVVSKDPLEGI